MSQENVELSRRGLDAFNRRDFAAFLALMDDDVEANAQFAPMEGGYHGHDGIRLWWENLLDVFPDFTIEVVELRDLGDLTRGDLRTRGHGAGSDTPFEETVCLMTRWRRGKCVSWGSYRTEADALEAVGLSE